MSTLLKYKVKDLIQAAKDGEVQIIGHGCNCQNTMGSGIAPLIAKAFPDAWEADQATKKADIDKLGMFSFGQSHESWGTLVIFNLYTQYGYWGRKKGQMDLDYNALRKALGYMALACSGKAVGLPKIGAGLAGGDWSVIEDIIKEELTDKGYDVTIYVLDEKEIPSER